MWKIIQKLQRKKISQRQDPVLTEQDDFIEEPEQISAPEELPKKTAKQELIIMYLKAPQDKLYSGYELLQALLSNGFRFGAMNIFHHYEKGHTEGKILFSLARATEPGIFDIRNMGACSCSGLTIFMNLCDHKNPAQVFANMLETAQKLADDLGGKILDENRQILDRSGIEKLHNKIKNYENSLYTYDLFENDS
jgi:cell division protein ZipA